MIGSVNFARSLVRQLGMGKVYLAMHQSMVIKPHRMLGIEIAKKRYLTSIIHAKPVRSEGGAIEAHMLLNHERIYEGLWSLYSFSRFSAKPLGIVIHDDGTLTEYDTALLGRIFTGCRIIKRPAADRIVSEYLRDKGLLRCDKLRRTLPFGLRLFDIFFFSQNRRIVNLDSDVLFFSSPVELIEGLDAPSEVNNLYSPDNNYVYCLSPNEMTVFVGESFLRFVNPGILRANSGSIDLERIERYLEYPAFWNKDGTANYFAELTLWAMELTKSAAAPLSNAYSICGDPRQTNLVSGHYCGGGYFGGLFYTAGLSVLAPILLERQ